MEKVSIIIPVYNAEGTLDRCLKSVFSQSYKNIEVILINDGSIDNSLDICKSYERKYSNMILVDVANGGVSRARNIGLAYATGKYIQFVDSDDKLLDDAIAEKVKNIEEQKVQMHISDYEMMDEEGKISVPAKVLEEGKYSRENFIRQMTKTPTCFYYGMMCNKLFLADIIRENKLKLDEERNFAEDFLFALDYLEHVDTIYAQNKVHYAYERTATANSLSKNDELLKHLWMDRKTIFNSYQMHLKNMGYYEANTDNYWFESFGDVIDRYVQCADKKVVVSIIEELAHDEDFYLVYSNYSGEKKLYALLGFLLKTKRYKMVYLMYWIHIAIGG